MKTRRRSDDFAAGVGLGLRLAAKTAEKIARMYNTPLYYWENGKVVARKPWLSKSSRAEKKKAKT